MSALIDEQCPRTDGTLAAAVAELRAGLGEDRRLAPSAKITRETSLTLATADVPRLAVKWALGHRGRATYGHPVIVVGRLYVTREAGRVYSLDAGTECSYWTYDAARVYERRS